VAGLDEIVRLRLRDRTTWRFCECAQGASDGPITLYATYRGASFGDLLAPAFFYKPAEPTISLESPAPVPFTAPGLTLGGVARWTRWFSRERARRKANRLLRARLGNDAASGRSCSHGCAMTIRSVCGQYTIGPTGPNISVPVHSGRGSRSPLPMFRKERREGDANLSIESRA
jgi:hypothetical protein